MADAPSKVVVEADGGSRGNPGPAAYGAVLKDAETGEVIAEDGTAIGRASNNVAEYRGLIAGLLLAAEHAPGAVVEARLDSKLVVEQMSGRWKIKHPDMQVLAREAGDVAPHGTTYTWVPRAENAHADRLANEALDGARDGVTVHGIDAEPADSLIEEVEESPRPSNPPARGWGGEGEATTVIIVRHGVTKHTSAKRFSGGLGGDNPALSEEGREQIRAVGDWLAPLAERVDAIVSSPVRRTRESGDLLSELLGGVAVTDEPGFAEMEFGHWDGLTFAEVAEQHGDEMTSWLGSLDVAPEGGESFRVVQERVLAARDRLLTEHAGRTVVVTSHVTPIKTLVADALQAPLDAVFRMELSPASVSVVTYYADGRASLRLFNALPPVRDAFASSAW
ncbi:bifunctional RNase H/acid phosphatase [Nocardioides sp.]|uniref:bifunctional RNase H/acid phosphatase n=1 Tax=Nocardioides sp. TaxID=35761 RepID=UPI002601F409|nr:bifunctional RNase H/acid phosphatase [Nocardioides sp.]